MPAWSWPARKLMSPCAVICTFSPISTFSSPSYRAMESMIAADARPYVCTVGSTRSFTRSRVRISTSSTAVIFAPFSTWAVLTTESARMCDVAPEPTIRPPVSSLTSSYPSMSLKVLTRSWPSPAALPITLTFVYWPMEALVTCAMVVSLSEALPCNTPPEAASTFCSSGPRRSLRAVLTASTKTFCAIISA